MKDQSQLQLRREGQRLVAGAGGEAATAAADLVNAMVGFRYADRAMFLKVCYIWLVARKLHTTIPTSIRK